ncbi:hypothetical protein [Streptococcus intermedius]
MKDIHKVKQGFSELTTVNEMGMRSPRDMERILEAGKIVLGTVAVGTFFAFPAAAAFLSTFTFGKLIATSALAIGTMITTNQVSDKNKSNYQKKEKDKD